MSAKHREHLVEEMGRERGADWVAQHRGLLDEQLDFLDREGVLMDDDEFERARSSGKLPPIEALVSR